MSAVSEEYVNNIMDKIISVSNLKDCKYTIEKFQSAGQNYFGVLTPVSVTAKDEDKDVVIDMVIKLAPTEEHLRVSGALTAMFAREIFVYSTLLEKYREYQNSFRLTSQYIMPKCYYICKDYCKEAIVMKNMCKDGFIPYTQESFLDFNHIAVALRALAKFHALSFIMKRGDPKLYEEVEKTCVPLTEKNNKRFMEILLDRLQKAIQKFENTKYVCILKDLEQNYVKYIESSTFLAQKTCICHGDIWKENILFKYENNTPLEACLIDYQTTRVCSPAFDTLYLITSSTDTILRKKHYLKLLDLYYESFEMFLNEAGLCCQHIFPRQVFDSDLKTVGPACLIIANTALWLANGLQEEGNVKSKLIRETPKEKEDAVNKYKSIIQGIFDDYLNYGYFT